MKKVLLMSGLLCVSLFGKELTLSGNIITTHNEAGGGYGIQTQKGVYGLCYMWDNEALVNKLQKLEESGQPVKLSGNQVDKWSLDCDSIKFANDTNTKKESTLKQYPIKGTHCKENEDVVFSCDTGKKVVSVCSSKNQSNNYIQYRFGKLDNPEALIPKNPTEFYNSVSAFHLNVGGTAEAKGLEFTNGDYLYGINSINNYFYVRKNGKDIAELSCKKDMIDNIDIEYLKAFGVKTETDE